MKDISNNFIIDLLLKEVAPVIAMVARQGLKQAAKQGAKQSIKAGAKQSIKQGVKQAAKQNIKQSTKQTLKQNLKNELKQWAKDELQSKIKQDIDNTLQLKGKEAENIVNAFSKNTGSDEEETKNALGDMINNNPQQFSYWMSLFKDSNQPNPALKGQELQKSMKDYYSKNKKNFSMNPNQQQM